MTKDTDTINYRGSVRSALESTKAATARAMDKHLDLLASGDKDIAKNRIARFVIYCFCVTVAAFILFIFYAAIFVDSQKWQLAIQPIMDILQKVFLPIVTLAFGFYNSSSSTDKE